jgi:predicted nicotinamide N-methyase
MHSAVTIQQAPSPQPLPETPIDALGPPIRERVLIEGKTFLINRPSESEKLLDHPFVISAFDRDEYMPYWTALWPSARMLAKVIVREKWRPGLTAVEIGCGLGLPGIAALSAGLQVTFSDYDATALRFAADNARVNGVAEFKLLQMDWRFPPPELQAEVILGSDLIYELRNVEPLVGFIKRALSPHGVCLMTDQDRIPGSWLRDNLAAEGLQYTTTMVRAGEPGGRRFKGTLYRISHQHRREL